MKYFPNNLTTVPLAVSASITSRSALIDNFAGTPIDSASLALNITGSRGTSGISYLVVGPTGSQGPLGPMGPPGDSIYMLPASRATYCTCNTVVGGTATTSDNITYICQTGTTYYSDCGAIAAGCQVFTDLGCAETVTNGLYAFNGIVYTAAGGTLTYTNTCSN